MIKCSVFCRLTLHSYGNISFVTFTAQLFLLYTLCSVHFTKVNAQNPVIQDSLASPAAGFDIFYLLYSAADSIKSIIKSK